MPDNVRDAIIHCESDGKNVDRLAVDGASTASGYYQFVDGTWRTFGGKEFAPRAIGATKAEQAIVADRAYDANGLRDWEETRSCWSKRVGRHAADTEAPKHVAPTKPRHAKTYTVQPGDTLAEIATAHHTTWQRIAAANPCVVDNLDQIFPGQRLNV